MSVDVKGTRSPLFTKSEAAKYLRLDVSAPAYPEQAIDRLLAKGELVVVRIGRRALLTQQELDRYIESKAKETSWR